MKARRHVEAFLGDIKVRCIVAAELRGAVATCAKRLDPVTVAAVRAAFDEAAPYMNDPLIVAMLERAEGAGE